MNGLVPNGERFCREGRRIGACHSSKTKLSKRKRKTDEKLSGLAGDINAKANRDGEAGEEGERTSPKKQSRNAT
jgi:hypothetical protein